MKLINPYEKFLSPSGPTVMVREDVLERYGVPEINHDGLEQLFTDGLKLPANDFDIKFYEGDAVGNINPPLDFWRNGFRTPFSNTLHIPVHDTGWDRTPMQRLINVGLLTSEKRHRSLPLRFLPSEVASGSMGLLVAGLEMGSPVLSAAGSLGICAVAFGKAGYSNPSQKVDVNRVLELRKAHDSDVHFPKLHRAPNNPCLDRPDC